MSVLSISGGNVTPENETRQPYTGAITMGLISAPLTIASGLRFALSARSRSRMESGVRTMAATATATATEIEADLLNRAARMGRPADPTFGPEAVSAIRALSRP